MANRKVISAETTQRYSDSNHHLHVTCGGSASICHRGFVRLRTTTAGTQNSTARCAPRGWHEHTELTGTRATGTAQVGDLVSVQDNIAHHVMQQVFPD